jgi:hypothetical protein
MPQSAEHRVSIYDDRPGDKAHYQLIAIVKDTGDLVLEGYDIGPTVEKCKGDIDYEYWRTVKAEHRHVPLVLLHLIKDRLQGRIRIQGLAGAEKGFPAVNVVLTDSIRGQAT